MQTLDETRHRSSPIDAQQRRQAAETLKPFMSALTGWNSKIAYLRGRADSVYSSDEDQTLARLESGTLLAEIRHRHADFRSAIKGEPAHSRLDDVDAAFRRLIDQLQSISDPKK